MNNAGIDTLIGAFTGPKAGTAASNNAKAALDIIATNLPYTEWQMAVSTIAAAPGGGVATLATITGFIEVQIFARVIATVTGTGVETLTVACGGVTIIAATTATLLAAGELWHDATPDSAVEDAAVFESYIINGQNITITQSGVPTAWTAGQVNFYFRWRELLIGSTLVGNV